MSRTVTDESLQALIMHDPGLRPDEVAVLSDSEHELLLALVKEDRGLPIASIASPDSEAVARALIAKRFAFARSTRQGGTLRATKLGRAVWLEAKYLFIQGRSRPLYFLGRRRAAALGLVSSKDGISRTAAKSPARQ